MGIENLSRAVSRSPSRVPSRGPADGLGNIITSIFADGTDGFYFDFSKTDRLFQNLSNTPADDPGENIYLGLESHGWGGRTYAQQLAAEPDKLSPIDFTSGWTVILGGGITDANTLTNTANGGVAKNVGMTVGRTYRFEISYTKSDASTAFVIYNNSTTGGTAIGVTQTQASGSFVQYFTAVDASIAFRINGAASVDIVSVSLKEIPGNHGQQTTTAAQPKYQTGGLARFDGTDDNLLTTLVPGLATTLIGRFSCSGANQFLIGADGGTNTRCYLAVDGTGKLGGGVGAQNLSTIVGGADIRNITGVGALTLDGSVVRLYWQGSLLYEGAQSGSPTVTVPFRIGSANNSGTPANFFSGDIYHALAIKKALTAAQIAAITNLWGTS